MNVAEAARATGLSRWTIRQAARRSQIAGTRDGRDGEQDPLSVRGFQRRRREQGANAALQTLRNLRIVK
jgi:hypothetical protein